MNLNNRFWVLLAVPLLASGCTAGSGEGVEEALTPPAAPVEQPPTENNSIMLSELQDEVLSPICAQCHAGNNAPLGLDMGTLGDSEQNLINVPSATNPTFMRVNPGDAENSFLYMKITGNPAAGNQMPLGQAPLTREVTEKFKQWIESGAPVNAAKVSVSAKTLASSDGSVNVVITFDQPIDQNSLPLESILWSSNVDNNAIVTPDISKYEWRDERILHIQVTSGESGSNNLKMIMNRPEMSTVLSKSGYWLDGDNNGQAGGEFSYEIVF